MDTIWVVAGVVVLGLTLVDVFLTALNYDEAGFFAGRLAQWQWVILRSLTRRMSRRWRPVALRQATGLQILVTVFAWLGGIILGFALIYYGMMHGKNFTYDGEHAGFFSAIYLSAAQFATVGTSQLSPNTDVLRILTILQSLTSLVMISLVLTFLLGVYQVISDLRSFSSKFYSPRSGAGDPIESLVPYFPNGEMRGLEGHLDGVSDSFGSYVDGVRLHHSAYYFQSGRDQFSLPYAVRMMAGTIGGLRWGLPTGHPAATQPVLIPLTVQFDQFREYMHPLLKWKSTDVPEALTEEEFGVILAAARRAHDNPDESSHSRADAHLATSDRWVHEFLRVNGEMSQLARVDSLADTADAYRRYRQWLPFAYRAQRFITAISRDLDYQPVVAQDLGTVATEVPGLPLGTTVPVQDSRQEEVSWWSRVIGSRLQLIDPGGVRLITAGRALIAAVAAVAIIAAILQGLGVHNLSPAVFGGMMAMLTGSVGSSPGKGKSITGLLMLIPVVFSVVLSALVPHDSYWSVLLLAAIAAGGMGLGGIDRRLAGLGQLAFVAYYFTLLLRVQMSELWFFVGAAVVGVLCSFVFQFLRIPGQWRRVIVSGVNAFEQRIVLVLDPLVDTVSAARYDPDLRKRVQVSVRQLHRSAAFLNGQLSGTDLDMGLDERRSQVLRLRVIDAELATVNLVDAARSVTGEGIPIELRARLAGQLERLQRHVSAYPSTPLWVTGEDPGQLSTSPAAAVASGLVEAEVASLADWPESARRLHAAIFELLRAADALHLARVADLGGTAADSDLDVDAPVDPAADASTSTTRETVPHSGRRAVQAAVSTGLAVSLGALVSPTYQYWAVMPAYQVLGTTGGEAYMKGVQKIIGTIAGAALGFSIAMATGSNPAIVLPLLGLYVFAMGFYRAVSSPLTSFWQTMMFAQLYDFLGKLDTERVELRVVETIVGAVIALVVAWLVLPTRTRSKLNEQTVAVLRTLNTIVASSVRRLSGSRVNEALDHNELRTQELALTTQLRAINATAAPLRYSSGAVDTGGIESRLTATWALEYYARHLVAAANAVSEGRAADPGGALVAPEEWQRVEDYTSDNVDALIAVLSGEVPGQVHEGLDLPELPAGEQHGPVAVALHELERINQMVRLLIDDCAPETVGASRIRRDTSVAAESGIRG